MTSLFRKFKQDRLAPFEYNTLNAGEIRLLRLQPSSTGFGTVSGSLVTLPLQESEDAGLISYEALSYVWGDEEPDCLIALENSCLMIKPNLEAALKVLNLDERSHQVRLMKAIYQRAHRVLIWIGDSLTGKDPVTEIIHTFTTYQRRGQGHRWLSQHLDNPHSRKETQRHLGLFSDYTEVEYVDRSGGHWPTLVKFLDRDWFQRVWVRQELIVSRDAMVLVGSLSVPWSDVATICDWLKIWTADLDAKTRKYGGRHRSGAYAGEELEHFRQALKTKGKLDFEAMFIHARNCKATDPRDKVYAILGLLGDDNEDIVVDYTLPVAEVAKQAFKKLVSRNNHLDALIFSQNSSREQGIPSWAPNICSPFKARPSRLKGRSSSIYNAAKGSVDKFSFLADGNTLCVQGLIFDTIEKVSKPLNNAIETMPIPLDRVISTWRPLLFTWLGTMDIDQKYECFMRTITRDRDIRGRRMPSRANGLDWAAFFRFEHLGAAARTELEYLAAAVHRSMFESAETNQAEVDEWVRLCSDTVSNSRMVLTANGKAGLVPAETQPWDVVCVIMGLDVPFVLRKIDADAYVLVGEAYIYGAMDGEVLTGGGFEDQDILLV
ncbi:hypothetical protein EG329_005747 [Mollisiaceae sp. DMI_Dod_QoI]|nr:hypothetical protein EG329_005747 [Helotiales sp. DMI_Dod_QoI]